MKEAQSRHVKEAERRAKDPKPVEKRKSTVPTFAAFVKANFAQAKLEKPHLATKDIMSHLSAKYNALSPAEKEKYKGTLPDKE